MAKPWKEVESSERFQSLPQEEQLKAQNQYFNDIVAPKVNPDDLTGAKNDFFAAYPRSEFPISEGFESPVQVDVKTGAKFLDRLDYSMSDTDEEITNKFTEKYPEGEMVRKTFEREPEYLGGEMRYGVSNRLIFKYDKNDPDESWKTIEESTLDIGDIADIAGPAIPVAASIGAGILTGSASLWAQALAYGGGYFAGELGKQAIEEVRGYQEQPWLPGEDEPSVLGQAAVGGGITATAAGVTGLIMKPISALSGRGWMKQHPEALRLKFELDKAKAAGLKIEEPMAHQYAPENMILNRLGAQAESTSKLAQHKIVQQQASAKIALLAAKKSKLTKYGADVKVKSEAEKVYRKYINRYTNQIGRVTPRQSQKALENSVDDFVTKSKADVSASYKVVDDIAAKEQPTFDLKPAMANAKNIRSAVMAEMPGGQVQVAPTPLGSLASVVDDIEKLSRTQVNYEAVKQLRTRVGTMIESWPWEADFNKGMAKSLYRSLTEVLENPSSKAPYFVRAHAIASAKARARFDLMDQMSIRRLIKSENTGDLTFKYAKPNAMTDAEFTVLNSKYVEPAKLIRLKRGIHQQIILDEGGSVNAINNWKAKDPEGWKFLVSKPQEKAMLRTAEKIDKLNASSIGQVVRQQSGAKSIVRDLVVKGNVTKKDIDFVINNFGPRGKEAVRAGIFEDIIEKSSTTGKLGIQTVDNNALSKVISEYKQSGLWRSSILTKTDRTKLEGLDAYLTMIMKRGVDPGVSLEAAQAITSLKSPTTFLSGVHKLSVNEIMARILMSKSGTKFLLGSGRTQFSANPLIRAELITEALLESTEPGTGKSMIMRKPEIQKEEQ